jgi:hypothetical protein
MTTQKLGMELTHDTRRQALARATSRYTLDHVPKDADNRLPDGSFRLPQHSSDRTWLNHSRFAVKKDHTLALKRETEWQGDLFGRLRTRVYATDSFEILLDDKCVGTVVRREDNTWGSNPTHQGSPIAASRTYGKFSGALLFVLSFRSRIEQAT